LAAVNHRLEREHESERFSAICALINGEIVLHHCEKCNMYIPELEFCCRYLLFGDELKPEKIKLDPELYEERYRKLKQKLEAWNRECEEPINVR